MRRPGSLILMTVDCLRADHVGFLGYDRPTTPFLDSLAGQSLVFSNAIAAGTPTYYSLPSLLASRYPLALGRDVLGLAPEETTVATALRESGFQTAAFLAANPYLSARFGYDAGFATFEDFLDLDALALKTEQATSDAGLRGRTNRRLSRICHSVAPIGRAYDELYFRYCQTRNAGEGQSMDSLRKFPSADVIVDRATSWLEENAGLPFFLWLHLMDPHAPYFPTKAALEAMGDMETDAAEAQYLNSYWARSDLDAARLQGKRNQVIALYDAGIRWVDAQLRRLTEALVKLDLWNSCTLAVTADHGEEFLDHGGRFHPPVKLNEELIRVPLLVKTPNPGAAARVIQQAFSLIDLAPTLLDAMELLIPGDFRGRSCWRDLLAGRLPESTLITESVCGCTNPVHAETRSAPRLLAVRRGRYKLVMDFGSGVETLFDLSSDPREQRPLTPGACGGVRRELLECAGKHIRASRKSRDLDKRLSLQVRELRLDWSQMAVSAPN